MCSLLEERQENTYATVKLEGLFIIVFFIRHNKEQKHHNFNNFTEASASRALDSRTRTTTSTRFSHRTTVSAHKAAFFG